jgi:ATP-dependent Clp protease ATP-binding subunit ClpC
MLWDRYTERARKVMLHAEDWAIRLRSPYISSEHILLGLLEEEDTLAVQILERLVCGHPSDEGGVGEPTAGECPLSCPCRSTHSNGSPPSRF